MFLPGSVPKGPHHFYIFQHKTKPWFKFGESRDPDGRRRNLGRSLRSREYRRWTFVNYYGCFYVEQTAIGLIKNLDFVQVRSQDWFELDPPTMDAIIVSIDELATSIIEWEELNTSTECDACRKDRPYGAFLHRTNFLLLQHWIENESGPFEPMDSLEERIDFEIKRLKLRRREIPEDVRQLILETFPAKLNALSS